MTLAAPPTLLPRTRTPRASLPTVPSLPPRGATNTVWTDRMARPSHPTSASPSSPSASMALSAPPPTPSSLTSLGAPMAMCPHPFSPPHRGLRRVSRRLHAWCAAWPSAVASRLMSVVHGASPPPLRHRPCLYLYRRRCLRHPSRLVSASRRASSSSPCSPPLGCLAREQLPGFFLGPRYGLWSA